jgi:hypothetical protein
VSLKFFDTLPQGWDLSSSKNCGECYTPSMASTRLAVTLLLVTLASSLQGCCCCFGGGSSPGVSGNDLVEAAGRGDTQRVHDLLDAGVSPRSMKWTSGGYFGGATTAVEAAVDSGKWEVVEPLLVDEEAKTKALSRALNYRANFDIAQRLVQKGAKPHPSWAFRAYTQALTLEDRAQAEALVKLLVELGMDPNAALEVSYKDSRPLVTTVVGSAVWHRRVARNEGIPYKRRPGGERISTWAPEVFILIARPRLDARDSDGQTALMAAAAAGEANLVQFLLEQGADPTLVDNEGQTAAAHAARTGHDDLATLLQAQPPSAPR